MNHQQRQWSLTALHHVEPGIASLDKLTAHAAILTQGTPAERALRYRR
jgi:hypothetical protein